MRRVLDDLPWMIGLLIIGLLLGSRIGAGASLWWLIIGLALVALVLRIAQVLTRSRSRRSAETS